jgi:vitamin B12 transporter
MRYGPIAIMLLWPMAAEAGDIRWCESDEETGHIYCPEEILVRGGRLQDGQGESAFATTDLDDIDLAQNPSGRVENLLRAVPGLTQFRRSDARSANPTSQGVTLRGLGGNAATRALVMLDGVPQNDPFGGWISWPSFEGLPLRAAHVRRGGGSGAEGPGALAGTVELFTLPGGIDSNNLIESDLLYGSRGSLSVRTQIAYADEYRRTNDKSRNPGILIGASYDRGDGFVPIRKAQRGPVDNNAGYEQLSLSAKANARVNDEIDLRIATRLFRDDRDRGVPFSANRTDGFDASIQLVDKDANQWSALLYAQLREFRSQFGSVNASRTVATQTLDQFEVPASGFGARFEYRPDQLENQLRLGADWRQVSGKTQELFSYSAGVAQRLRRAGGDATTLGAFAEYSATALDGLNLTGSVRLDHWYIGAGYLREQQRANGANLTDAIFPSRTGTEWTGRAGFDLDLSSLFDRSLILRGAAYRGWRLPTLNELYRPFRVGTDAIAANAALSPERLDGFDIGFRLGRKSSRLREGQFVDVTAFYNRLDNAIANVTIGAGPGIFPGVGFVATGGLYKQRQNLDRILSKGLEVELASPVGPLQFTASYALIDARIKGGSLNGLRPAQVAKHSASAKIGWNDDAYQGVSIALRYMGNQFEDDLNLVRLKDAFTIDSYASLRISQKFMILLRGENLLGNEVQVANNNGIIERASPRTIWLGMRFAVP